MLSLLSGASPLTVAVALVAIVIVQLYIRREACARVLEECYSISDWWNIVAGFVMGPSLNRDGICEACGAPAHLRCARCKHVRYCSSDCQRRHWRSGHKAECGKPRVQLTEEELEGRRAALDAKHPEPYPAADDVLFSYDKFLQLLQDEDAYLPDDTSRGSGPPVGLFNVGNTCYANSVLQCLFATPSFAGFLFEFARWKNHQDAIRAHRQHQEEQEQEEEPRVAAGANWSLLGELSTLLHVATSSATPVSPKPLLGRINRIGRHLTFGRQEDSHDFLLTLLDAIETELLQLAGGKEKILDPRTRETTYVFHAFGGYMRQQVLCCDCNYLSKKFEPTVCLNLEIPGHISTLKAALDLHCAEEALEGLNKYQCDCCRNKVRALKSSQLEAAPNVLVLALKRFAVGRFGKLNKKISYPDTLDMSEHSAAGSIDPGPQVYSLYGILVHLDHMNSTTFGHYISYIKTPGDRWYLCDDSRVTPVTAAKAFSQNAYMLFYARDPSNPKAAPLLRPPGMRGPARGSSQEEKGSGGEEQSQEDPRMPDAEGIVPSPSSAAALHHGLSHVLLAPGSVMERTFSSPAVLSKLGSAHVHPLQHPLHNLRREPAAGAISNGNGRNSLPVHSTSSSDSGLSGIGVASSRGDPQDSARGSLEEASASRAATEDPEEAAVAVAAVAAEQLQQNGPAPVEGEGEGGEGQQRLLTPHYRVNTSQDYEGGPQMMELLVDMPGAKSHELDVFTEQVLVGDPRLPGPSDLSIETENEGGAATQVVVTVLAEGRYELRVPLGSHVEPMLHPAKFNKKSGRLRVYLVTAPEQQEHQEAQQPRPTLRRRAASKGAGQKDADSDEEEGGGADVQESSEAVEAGVASLGLRP